MILSLNEQARLFLFTVIIGGLIGGIYDVVRIFRKMIPHKLLLIQLEDALYWIGTALFVFFLLLQKNHGELRFFVVLGTFLGMGLYFLTVSPIVNKVSDTIVAILHKLLRLFLTILFTPFRLIYLLLRKPIQKTNTFFHRKMKKVLQFCKGYVRIKKRNVRRNVKILLHKK